MSEKTKKKIFLQSVFIFLFTEFFTKILLTQILFFHFLYRIGNIVINTLQLCAFALDSQYFLDQVCAASL